MKTIRVLLFITTFIANIIILTGCWDYSEVNEHAVVTGVAVDKRADGDGYSITVEVVDLRGKGKETGLESKRIESQGSNLGDAFRNLVKVSGKKMYWSHAEIVIIGKEAARHGILPVIDVIHRQYQPRLYMHILVSKEQTAKELLSQQSITTEIRAMEMREMINSEKQVLSKAPHVDVRNFINDLGGEGISAVLPTVGIVLNEGQKTSELSGTAIFKGDKLIGMLNEEDTKFLLMVKNEVKGGLLMLSEKLEGYEEVALDIKDNKTKVTPVYVNGKISMSIEVNTKLSIGELGISEDLIDEKGREKLKIEAEKTLKTNIENVINKAKSEYDADIFGFGSIVKREMPSLWKSMDSNWSTLYTTVPVNVAVTVEIISSGLSSKPIKVGD